MDWTDGHRGLIDELGEDRVAVRGDHQPLDWCADALRDLGAGTWFAGLRRDQSESRADTPFLSWSGDRWKVHAIADWTDRDVYLYLKEHDLPYHPLWDQGYVSVGDVHTTQPLHAVDDENQTRFFGLKRECGLHEIDLSAV